MDDIRRIDRRRLDGYTISSHCEPNGSGEQNISDACETAIGITHISEKIIRCC